MSDPTSSVTRLPLVTADMSDVSGLVAVIRRLSLAQSLPEIMQIVAPGARGLLGADGVTFVLREGALCYYAEEDAIAPLWKGKRFPLSACISGWCMTHKQPAAIPDIYRDARIPQDAYRPTFVRSLAMVPVRQEDPIAAMGAYWATPHQPSQAEVEVLQTIANAAALAIAHVQLANVQLRQASTPEPDQDAATTNVPVEGTGIAAALSKWLLRHGQVRPNSPAALMLAVGCVAIASLLRFGVGAMFESDLAPFVTYYPAILIAALAAGANAGFLALLLGGLAAWWAFVPPHFTMQVNSQASLINLALYLITGAVVVGLSQAYRGAARRSRAEEAKRLLLLRELQHRNRNTLAVAQSIVSDALRHDRVLADDIVRRLTAYIRTNDLLTRSQSRTLDLRAILENELEAYGAERVALDGPALQLDAEIASALGLMFHELATNAAKYGALSVPAGCLSVTWTRDDGRVRVTWAERNGPPVEGPLEGGFGTRFIERLLRGFGGEMKVTPGADGLTYAISVGVAD